MKESAHFILTILVALSGLQSASAQTGFTYQGKLTDDCCPATGRYDLTFRVYDNAGTQLGNILAYAAVPVTNGLFTVNLDFGSGVFTGPQRWLQMDARTNNPAASYVALT